MGTRGLHDATCNDRPQPFKKDISIHLFLAIYIVGKRTITLTSRNENKETARVSPKMGKVAL